MKVILSWTNLDNAVTDSCSEGYSGWIVLTSKHAVCQLSTHVRKATTRDEINNKRLLSVALPPLIVDCNEFLVVLYRRSALFT